MRTCPPAVAAVPPAPPSSPRLPAPSRARAEGEVELRRNLIVKVVEKRRAAVVSIRTNQIVKRSWFDIWGYRHMGRALRARRRPGLGRDLPPRRLRHHQRPRDLAREQDLRRHPHLRQERPRAKAHEHRALPVAIDIENDLAILRSDARPGAPPRALPVHPARSQQRPDDRRGHHRDGASVPPRLHGHARHHQRAQPQAWSSAVASSTTSCRSMPRSTPATPAVRSST